jgi:hypothetical protein
VLSPTIFLHHDVNLLHYTGGWGEQYGRIVAIPAIAEKVRHCLLFKHCGLISRQGYLDVRVEVSTPGGHSSVPPPHTVSLLTQHHPMNA